jgi:hypothetical protein
MSTDVKDSTPPVGSKESKDAALPIFHVRRLGRKNETKILTRAFMRVMDAKANAADRRRCRLYLAAIDRIHATSKYPPPYLIHFDGLGIQLKGMIRAEDHHCKDCKVNFKRCQICMGAYCPSCHAQKHHKEDCGDKAAVQKQLDAKGFLFGMPELPFLGYTAASELLRADHGIDAAISMVGHPGRPFCLFFEPGGQVAVFPARDTATECWHCKTSSGTSRCSDCNLQWCKDCHSQHKEGCRKVQALLSKTPLKKMERLPMCFSVGGVNNTARALAYGVPRESFYRMPPTKGSPKPLADIVPVLLQLARKTPTEGTGQALLLHYKEGLERIQAGSSFSSSP